MKIEGDQATRENLPTLPMPAAFPINFSHSEFLAQWLAAAAVANQMPLHFNHYPHLFSQNWHQAAASATANMMNIKGRSTNFNNNIVTSTSERQMQAIPEEEETARENATPSPLAPSVAQSSPMHSPRLSLSPPSSENSATEKKEASPKDNEKKFPCLICKRVFGYKHVLQNHERTHTGEKPFECPECNKRFTRDHHLKTHMRLHTGERPYSCDFCDRQFVQVANLRRHLRVHTGEKPYICDCSARFSDSNQLKTHMMTHTDEKPFSCEKCSGKFRRRHHLTHHKCTSPVQRIQKRAQEAPLPMEATAQRLTQPAQQSPVQAPRTIPVPMRTPISAPMKGAMATMITPPETPRSKFWYREPSTSPINMHLPVQTEPEDLSMSTGSHSRSASSIENDEDERSS